MMRFMLRLRTTLRPKTPPVPLLEILLAWEREEFAPAACRDQLERIIREHKIPSELFDCAEIMRGGRPATDCLLFDWYKQPRDWTWWIHTPSGVVVHEVPS